MCGVVGYVGKNLCKSYIMEGLKRLEYRGYDSAGFACIDKQTSDLVYDKAEGQLINLTNKLENTSIDGYIGIGHTRWATHGGISEKNAHPQFDCELSIAVVHNGIIENHHALKRQLVQAHHAFVSDTDTEVVAHICEQELKHYNDFPQAIRSITQKLLGAYSFVALLQKQSENLVAVRKGSPLCIGIGKGQMFIASDPLAFAGFVSSVVFLPDESYALVNEKGFELFDFNGNKLDYSVSSLDIEWTNDGKNGFKHYMLKEIYEQKNSIQATLSHLKNNKEDVWQSIGLSSSAVQNLEHLSIVAAGTSWHAGRIGQFFEKLCMLPTHVMLSSEFRYMPYFRQNNSLSLFISQSGETVDTLECLHLVKSMQAKTLALTNVASSIMAREADGAITTRAGREIAVASTKAFSTQLTALYWLANKIAFEKGLITQIQMDQASDDILIAAEVLENSIGKYYKSISKELAPFYAKFKRFIFLGRHISYPFAMEAALKLKEISYIFSQCYPAGELKHGPIALLDKETPVILFSNLDERIYQKVVSNAQEVKARGAHLVAFLFEGQDELASLADCCFVIPKVNPLLAPLAMTGVMQFFVYEIANVLGCPIDKPRNLAKSVTVE